MATIATQMMIALADNHYAINAESQAGAKMLKDSVTPALDQMMKYVEKIATLTLTVVILIAITVESLVSVSMCKAGVTMATVKLK